MAEAKIKKDTPEESAAFLQTLAGTDKEGNHAVVFGEDISLYAPKYHFPTGVDPLDAIIGEGGFASGKISEIYGPERTGKTELVQCLNRNFLMSNPTGLAIYFDQELSVDDKKLAQSPVFSCDRMLVTYSDTAEKLFAYIEKIITEIHAKNSKMPILISLDSLAAVETEAQAKGDVGDAHVAPLARVMSAALRRIKPILQKTNAHLTIINQVRTNIGAAAFVQDDSPGGRALKFYADYRIRTSSFGQFFFRKLKDVKPAPDGFIAQFETKKNKRVAPDRKIKIPLIFQSGDWGPSGFNNCWAIWQIFTEAKFFKAGGGQYYFLNHKELGSFEKFRWPEVFMDKDHPLQPVIKAKFDEWEDSLMNQTTLGDDAGKFEIEAEEVK